MKCLDCLPHQVQTNCHFSPVFFIFLLFFFFLPSLFVLSNETINIWSHLSGLFYFLYLALYDNFVYIPERNGSFPDHMVFSALLIGFQVSLALPLFLGFSGSPPTPTPTRPPPQSFAMIDFKRKNIFHADTIFCQNFRKTGEHI